MADDDATRAYYDEFSGWYERERAYGYHAMIDELEVSIAEPFARGKRVLEVGCGTGLILQRLGSVAKSAHGIDLSEGMLRVARGRGLAVSQGLATQIGFPDASFELVCSFKVLAHVPEIELALSEMARVCAPGGTVLAEFYNPWSLRYLAKKLGPSGAISDSTTEAAVYTRYDSARRIRQIVPNSMELLGFRGVRVITPVARVVSVPVLGAVVRAAERRLSDSALARLAGFLVAVMRRR